MTTTNVRMHVFEHAEDVARAAADLLGEEVSAQREIALALPTGRTPIPFYDELAARHVSRRLDLSRARGFNLDELVLPPEDPRTFRTFMARHAWARTGLRRERCDLPNGAAGDLEAECLRYERAITEAGAQGGAHVAAGGSDRRPRLLGGEAEAGHHDRGLDLAARLLQERLRALGRDLAGGHDDAAGAVAQLGRALPQVHHEVAVGLT